MGVQTALAQHGPRPSPSHDVGLGPVIFRRVATEKFGLRARTLRIQELRSIHLIRQLVGPGSMHDASDASGEFGDSGEREAPDVLSTGAKVLWPFPRDESSSLSEKQ